VQEQSFLAIRLGEQAKSSSTTGQGVILYDPDSADDLDDDDPDEDLDI
jgi:elongator complex protein 5